MSNYTTRTMLPAVEVMPRVASFLRETFFPRAKDNTVVTEKVELDYKKGKRKMAPFVAPRVGGITQTRDGFKTFEIAPPRIAPQILMTVEDLTARSMGENVYSKKTPAQREQELLAKDLTDLGSQIDRREEWMAAQLLFNGKVVVQGYSDNNLSNPIEQEIDYGFDNYETLSGTDLFTDPAAKPLTYLREQFRELVKKSGVAPNILVFGSSAYEGFISNTEVQEYFDKRHMQMGQIKPSVQSENVVFIGRLDDINVEMYLYNDWYIDEAGVEHSFVPSDKMLLGHTGVGHYEYAAVTQLENNGKYMTYEGTRVPKFWSDLANDAKMVRLTSRPVPLPSNIDAWFVATVV